MKSAAVKVLSLLLIALSLGLAPRIAAQGKSDAGYQEEKAKAIRHYGEGKYLDALSLFEDLAAERLDDDKVLLGLAACLVNHSAAVSDPDTAGRERA